MTERPVKLRSLLFAPSIGLVEKAVVIASMLLAGLATILVADKVFVDAVRYALPLPSIEASPILVESSKPSLLPTTAKILEDIYAAFTRLFSSTAWSIVVVEAIAVSATLYPFYDKLRPQLPVAIYRASTTPCRIYAWFIATSFALCLPVVFSTLLAPILVLVYNGVPGFTEFLLNTPYYALIVLAEPFLFASLVLATDRYDYSLIALIFFSSGLYTLRARLAIQLALLATLAVIIFLCIFVNKYRWIKS